MNKSLLVKINTGLKILVLGSTLPLLLHDSVWGQEGCSQVDIKANIERFQNGDYEAQEFIVQCKEKSLNLLIDTLQNKAGNTGIRHSAVDLLGEIKSSSPKVLDTLIRVVADKNDNSSVRSSAVDLLGEIKSSSPKVLDTLIRVVADKNDDAYVRRSAVYSLGKIKSSSPKVLDTLIRVVADKNNYWDVRRGAVYALGEIKSSSPKVLDALIRVVADKNDNWDVRSRAVYALGKIKSSSPKVLDTLIRIVADKNYGSDFRSSAVDALGEIKSNSPKVLDTLIRVVEDKNDNSDVHISGVYALGNVGWSSPKAVETLRRILSEKDSDFHNDAAEALVNIGSNLENIIRTEPQKISRENLKKLLKEFETTVNVLKANQDDFEPKQIQDIEGTIYTLRGKISSGLYGAIFQIGWKVWLIHGSLWLLLIFCYPKSPFIQAIFFWNPKVRKWVGLYYVDFALTWVPFFRSRLFAPFKDSLLADAHLDSFDPNAYFPNSHVKQKAGTTESKPIPEVIPEIKGQLILEGESGLGKSMFLRDLAKKSQRIVVYLPAKKCDQGVLEAIKNKLHGHVKEDPNFLKNLIYSGAIDIYIDGLNEVTPDTRANITNFVESYFKGNIIMATQPLEWTPPSTAKSYILQPLQENQIEDFLCSRKTILPQDAPLQETEYKQVCRDYLTKTLAQQHSDEEKIAIRRMLSNPMELTVVAQMLAENKTPNLLKLQQEQYEMMAEDYDQLYPVKKFPLKDFSEAVYQMRINDQYTIPAEHWQQELKCMERYKMVISRQIIQENTTQIEWYFRHDKIQDFFVVQTFLEPENENRLLDHISDSRFRGVYFLLANMMPFDAAKKLREDLIQYAAETKDHTVSDTFIQLFRNRQVAYV